MLSGIENTPNDEKDIEETQGSSEERSSSSSIPTDNQDTKASTSARSSSARENDGNEDDTDKDKSSDSPTPPQAQWQAIFSPEYNAYYFYNAVTQEVTWTNPLEPEASSSTSAAASSSSPSNAPEEIPSAGASNDSAEAGTSATAGPIAQYAALQAAALAQGIDPALAHLDPSLLAPSVPGSARGPGDLPTFTAQFNARTGAFAPTNSRTPGHLSEHERAKRMSEFYFDVGKWEQDLAAQGGSIRGGEEEDDGTGKKRKRPTKKDLERFKEQKRLKKIAKTAWLRT